MRALLLCIASFLLLSVSPNASAEGLVQLALHGEISSEGGAPIEVEIGLWDGAQVRDFEFNVHLGERTGARDLAWLLASRLRRFGAQVEIPEREVGSATVSHLFIEAVTHVKLRLGHGLWSSVTLCDAAPSAVRFQPPHLSPDGAEIRIVATTFHAHSRRIGRASVSLEVDRLTTSAQISERLAAASIASGWVAERPTADRWAASRSSDGAAIFGCSIELRSPGADWRVEVQLEVPRLEPSLETR